MSFLFKTSASLKDTLAAGVLTREEFTTAYNSGYRRTMAFMLSRGMSHENSEDLAQAAWAKGWQYRAQIRDVDKVGAWVNTIALNLLRGSCRSIKTGELPDDMSVAPQIGPESIDAQGLLKQCFNECSSADRKLIKGYSLGYTSFELGRQLRCTAVAARVRLLRLRRRLQTTITSRPRSEAP